MRAAVNTQMKITMFFRVGRCVIRDEIRDPSVTLCVSSFPLTTDDEDDEDDVEFNCVAGDEGVCGSPLTLQRAAMRKVKTRLYATMVAAAETKFKKKAGCFSFSSFLSKTKMKCAQQLSHDREDQAYYHWQVVLFIYTINIHLQSSSETCFLEVSCSDSFLIALGLRVEIVEMVEM